MYIFFDIKNNLIVYLDSFIILLYSSPNAIIKTRKLKLRLRYNKEENHYMQNFSKFILIGLCNSRNLHPIKIICLLWISIHTINIIKC